MTPEQLAEIRARAGAATLGPWHQCGHLVDGECDCPHGGQVESWPMDRPLLAMLDPSDDARRADSGFIAHARTDIPALLDYIEELQAVLWRAAGVYGEPLTDIEALRKSHRIISDFLTSKEPTNA